MRLLGMLETAISSMLPFVLFYDDCTAYAQIYQLEKHTKCFADIYSKCIYEQIYNYDILKLCEVGGTLICHQHLKHNRRQLINI